MLHCNPGPGRRKTFQGFASNHFATPPASCSALARTGRGSSQGSRCHKGYILFLYSLFGVSALLSEPRQLRRLVAKGPSGKPKPQPSACAACRIPCRMEARNTFGTMSCALASRRPRHTGWAPDMADCNATVWKPARENQPRRFDFPWQPRHGVRSRRAEHMQRAPSFIRNCAGMGEVT